MGTPNHQTTYFPQEPSRFWLRIKRLYLPSLVGTLACIVLHADVRAESKAQKIETLLQTAHSRGQFNGTALAGDKGQIVYTGAIGYADFDKKIPLTTDSIFELASVSKPFTALAIMMLKEHGKLSYDDPLTKYFPELPYQHVTIRHLLTHTSGLPDPEPLFRDDWPGDKMATNADLVARLALLKPPTYFAAGEQWRYNTTAYFLLAEIVEKVSGTTYGEFLRANVFQPLEMNNTLVFNRLGKEKREHLAYGYMPASMLSDKYALPETLPRYSYIVSFGDTSGAKGICSTVGDLFKFVTALDDGKLVKPETLDEAYTPVKLNDGTTPSAGGGGGNDIPSNYGFGWFVEQGPYGKTVRHTGDWPGYITCLIHNLDKSQTIIVLTSAGDPSAVDTANAIENILNDQAYSLPRMSIGRTIGKTISEKGIEAAISQYRDLKKTRPDDYNFNYDSELNLLGYELLRRGEKPQAIEVFKLNLEAFPNSWAMYDSLAEAYLADGNNELATKNYRRSVELNPDNSGGREALKRLEGK